MKTEISGGKTHRFLAMTVNNVGFLLDRLGQDCHPLQYIRELTQNAIEAIGRTPKKSGEIIWDFEPIAFKLEHVRRLCIIDNGDGMTGDEMVKFINQLSSSVAQQFLHGNYGVGAKIAAATRNPAGISYFSWKNGNGAMIFLYYDEETGQYGLRQWQRADGSWAHYLPIGNDLKPSSIVDHGTMVVLHGTNAADWTLTAPSEAPAPRRWITRYLNTRYFEVPKGVSITCREGNLLAQGPEDNVGGRRQVWGQGKYLRRYGKDHGTVALTGAKAHWWIIREKKKGEVTDPVEKYSGHLEAAGHVAALYQNELYEMTTGRSGMIKLQQFGVTFGYGRVVIYVEPTVSDQLTTNTARTTLLLNNAPLPWAEWAAEFRDHMPFAIKTFVEAHAPNISGEEYEKGIQDRLKPILDLYKVSAYRPVARPTDTSVGVDNITTMSAPTFPDGQDGQDGEHEHETPRHRTPSSSSIYALFERTDGGDPAEKVALSLFPSIDWVSVKDGSRQTGDMEDRAAKYLLDQNRLLINADFKVFTDMTEFFAKQYPSTTGGQQLAENAVRNWFSQALVETVIGVLAMQKRQQWTIADVEKALSEEALTAATMARYHILTAVKRELAIKIGKLTHVAA